MKVGDKVVCINDDFTQHIELFIKVYDVLPRKGQVYTIRRKEMYDGKIRLLLEEIKNPPFQEGVWKGVEPGFDSKRFAPPQTNENVEELEEVEVLENENQN